MRYPCRGLLILCLMLALGASTNLSLHAQSREVLGHADLTSGQSVREVLRPVAQDARRHVVIVTADGKDAALGLAVSPTRVITKASEVRGNPAVRVIGGKMREAMILASDRDFDVALLEVKGASFDPVVLEDDVALPRVGQWVVTVGVFDEPIAVGVVSVQPRRLMRQPGALGIRMGDVEGEGVVIAMVYPDSSGEAAGLKPGDIVTHVNARPTRSHLALREAIGEHGAGDTITIRIVREGQKQEIRARLGGWARTFGMSRGDLMDRMGGPVSERASGFPQVLQHDTVLRPQECGGPLVDLDGRIIGLNIARAGRTDSYAIPADALNKLIAHLTAEADKANTPPTDPTPD